ncbi:hypothetical protein [Streptomyces sp. 900105755]
MIRSAIDTPMRAPEGHLAQVTSILLCHWSGIEELALTADMPMDQVSQDRR